MRIRLAEGGEFGTLGTLSRSGKPALFAQRAEIAKLREAKRGSCTLSSGPKSCRKTQLPLGKIGVALGFSPTFDLNLWKPHPRGAAGEMILVAQFTFIGAQRHIGTRRHIEGKGAHLASLTEQIDTSTSGGRLVFHVMGALVQFERDLISERTKAGLQAAKAEGVKLGRPTKLTPSKLKHAKALIEQGERPTRVAKSLGVGASTWAPAITSRI